MAEFESWLSSVDGATTAAPPQASRAVNVAVLIVDTSSDGVRIASVVVPWTFVCSEQWELACIVSGTGRIDAFHTRMIVAQAMAGRTIVPLPHVARKCLIPCIRSYSRPNVGLLMASLILETVDQYSQIKNVSN